MLEYIHNFPLPHDNLTTKITNIATFLHTLQTHITTMQTNNIQAYTMHTEVFGMIQGVGFRPFVAALAHTLNLCGAVYNQSDSAVIILNISNNITKDSMHNTEVALLFYTTLFLACGHTIITNQTTDYRLLDNVLQKATTLLTQLHLPKHAFIQSLQYTFTKHTTIHKTHHFTILPSKTNTQHTLQAHIPLDTKVCESCLQDMQNPHSRFYNYPFSACVNCGARYSILTKLPYDRKHTSMASMDMCAGCSKDYTNLHDRRFHTEPISCNHCAIKVCFSTYKYVNNTLKQSTQHYDIQAIESLATALMQNKVILLKGLGGFAYIANAHSKEALQCVRSIKARKNKPFVVMAALSTLRKIALLTPYLESLLTSQYAPIILVPKHPNYNLSDEVCSLQTIGIMIPYTAMLALLFQYLPDDFALIYTSANNKGEMIATELHELQLQKIMEHVTELSILDYERIITNRVDDSIMLGIDIPLLTHISKDLVSLQADNTDTPHTNHTLLHTFDLRAMRVSRGFSPLHLTSSLLHFKTLCVGFGAMQKSSLAFGKGSHIVVSPYMGDLFSPYNIANFRKNFDFLSSIYGQPQVLIADKHPHYTSTKIAQEVAMQYNIPLFHIAHHHAHFNALLLEANQSNGVGIIFDGSGLGDDGTLWGGEFLSGDFKQVKRMLHFKPFMILGGEQHVRDSKRLAYSYALCNQITPLQTFIESTYSIQEYQVLQHMYNAKINAPLCSSVGRLFDIAGFILGLHTLEYEGQSGEMIASYVLEYTYNIATSIKNHKCYNSLLQTLIAIPYQPYPFNIEKGQIDISPCVLAMLQDMQKGIDKNKIALRFIDTLAYCILESLQIIGTDYGLFGGGVFANYALCMRTQQLLQSKGIKAFFPKLPCNDYSISIGQLTFLQHIL